MRIAQIANARRRPHETAVAVLACVLLMAACGSGEDGVTATVNMGSDSVTALSSDIASSQQIPDSSSSTSQDVPVGAPDSGAPAEDIPSDQEITSQEDIGLTKDADGAHDSNTPEDINNPEDSAPSPTDEGEDSGGVIPISCPFVPEPEPISLTPMESETPPGIIGATSEDGFMDHYLYNSAATIKVGVRAEWGASIVFFGQTNGADGMNTTNTIDANDTGREVQIALYDPDRIMQGCAWNASCQSSPTTCPHSITFLGWNPVQGGNRCNNGSGYEDVWNEPGKLHHKVRPLFWNPDWERQDCQSLGCNDTQLAYLQSDVLYTQELRFVGSHLLEMYMRVENLSNIDHASMIQEFPTLYASYGAQGTQNLNRLLDSEANHISIDESANDGFYKKDFSSQDGWVTLQNGAQDYGVGIYYENRQTDYQGWQKAGVFNNVRARFEFGIPALSVVEARAYLALGSFETIKSVLEGLDQELPPIGRIDAPEADAEIQGNFVVRGWVLDNKGVSTVEIMLGEQVLATTALNQDRPDICSRYPGYPQCTQVGFEANVPLEGILPCAGILKVRATDSDGNIRVIDQRRIQVINNILCTSDADCDDGLPCTIDQCDVVCSWTPTNLPMGSESCNGVDDDCDGDIDEPGALGCAPWYIDVDGDGAGGDTSSCQCEAEPPYTATSDDDCDDYNPDAAPGKTEECNGFDDNCDGTVDPPVLCPVGMHDVHRFYYSDGITTDHMMGLSTTPDPGYAYEGVAFKLFDSGGPGLQPLYQVYNPVGVDHMQTLLISEGSPDYGDPEILGYCSTSQTELAPHEIRRIYDETHMDHFVSSSEYEWGIVEVLGYQLESLSCWVP